MRGNFTLRAPDDVEATMSVTMTLGQWKALRNTLGTATWPACDFTRLIDEIVNKAERSYDAKVERGIQDDQ